MHRIRAWGRPLIAACLALAGVGVAQAQDEDYEFLPEWYLGPLVGQVLPDSARNTDAGINLHFVLGASIADSLAIEANVFGSEAKSSVAGVDDTSLQGAGLDLTLGTPAPGNPFFLIGGGAVSQDAGGNKETSTFGNLGIGAYLPFSLQGELWRLEGRYHLVFADQAAAGGDELLEDGRINLGVLFAFGRRQTVAALEEPELAPDADGDGVPDAMDKCPETPTWARPDNSGCIPDRDGDGIDDARDQCPETAAGVTVDASGCEPKAAPPPEQTPAQAAALDTDHDGVADGVDRCPDTTSGLDVDANGCVKPETVTLRNLHFDLESSRLTGDGFILLRQVAAAMKASPDMRLEVSGHTDATGSRYFNEKLSIERAQVVHDFLTYLDIAEGRMQLKAYGETKPVGDNKTDEGRAYNRRVEFRRLD